MGNLVVIWYNLPRFGIYVCKKSGNPERTAYFTPLNLHEVDGYTKTVFYHPRFEE
jgi:hypothetical protein